MPCYRDQQQLDKDIVPKLLPSVAGHCCFQDKETSLIQREPTRLASASPSGSNGDDRRQRRKQGVAVGAAASRMRATAQQTLGAATRPCLRSRLRGCIKTSLPSVARPALLRHIGPHASSKKWPDMPMALPMGELARQRLRGQARLPRAATQR